MHCTYREVAIHADAGILELAVARKVEADPFGAQLAGLGALATAHALQHRAAGLTGTAATATLTGAGAGAGAQAGAGRAGRHRAS